MHLKTNIGYKLKAQQYYIIPDVYGLKQNIILRLAIKCKQKNKEIKTLKNGNNLNATDPLNAFWGNKF